MTEKGGREEGRAEGGREGTAFVFLWGGRGREGAGEGVGKHRPPRQEQGHRRGRIQVGWILDFRAPGQQLYRPEACQPRVRPRTGRCLGAACACMPGGSSGPAASRTPAASLARSSGSRPAFNPGRLETPLSLASWSSSRPPAPTSLSWEEEIGAAAEGNYQHDGAGGRRRRGQWVAPSLFEAARNQRATQSAHRDWRPEAWSLRCHPRRRASAGRGKEQATRKECCEIARCILPPHAHVKQRAWIQDSRADRGPVDRGPLCLSLLRKLCHFHTRFF